MEIPVVLPADLSPLDETLQQLAVEDYLQINAKKGRYELTKKGVAYLGDVIDEAEHMVADVPLGAFLSGGIDSSAVAVLMAQHSAEPLNTYSIGYGGSGAARYYNELPYARVVASRLASCHASRKTGFASN